jgi:hypothetical protein
MSNDPRQVRQDFTRWRDAGLGIPTGKVNGLFVVEADTKKIDGVANLKRLTEQQGGGFPLTPTAISPSGSPHFYFRHPGGDACIQNSRSKLAPGVDVRGDGGMVIAPPTLRTDGQYRWVNGLAINQPPPWLLERVLAKHEQIKVETPAPQILAGDGFDAHDIEPIEKIKAALAVLDPQKLGHDGLLKIGCALFNELGDVDGFDVLTEWLKRFAGYYDPKVVNEQWKSVTAKNGYAYKIATLYYLADEADSRWRNGDSDREEPATGKAGAQQTTQSHTGDIEPVDLWGRFDPPALPQGLLPETIERFAHEEAELMGVDPGGLAMAALAVCAAALPDHTQLQVKRHDPNWLEAARLWVGLIGSPSTKKTPVILRATKPLKRLDAELWRRYLAEMECYEQLSKEDRKNAERPKQQRLRLEDTTIEAAQEVLKDSPDGVLCIQDELAGWFGAMDKYAGRGANKDRGFWLQSFHGGPYALNRIARGAAMIENLSVSLLGGIQPDPIRKIAAETVDDGLLQRLIPIVLRRGSAGQDAPHINQDYNELIVQLRDYPPPPQPLQFTDAALAIRQELEQKHLDLMAYEIINRKLASHIGKYDGLFARFCLLWHCIEGTEELAVSEHTARRVADFMRRFLLPHATAFYAGMLELSDDHDCLTSVAGYILAKKLLRVTNRDVQRSRRAMRGLKGLEIECIFEQLEALGWLVRADNKRWAARPQWLVNPAVHHRFAGRAKREVSQRAKDRAMLQEMFSGDAN